MKKNTPLLAVLFVCAPVIIHAQKGFWVVESNIRLKKGAIIRYYTEDKLLTREEHITGKRLNLKKKKTLCYLNEHLDSALEAYAQTTRVLLDNDKVKITEYTSQPGQDVCGVGNHTHGNHATVLFTDARVRTIQPDGTTRIETYLVDKHQYIVTQNGKEETINTDGAFWVTAATHSVTNIGNNVMKFYIIETK